MIKLDNMAKTRKKEGKPLPETADMKMWKKEYENMSEEEHHQKLKQLGLSDEDMKEFDEVLEEEKKEKKSESDEDSE